LAEKCFTTRRAEPPLGDRDRMQRGVCRKAPSTSAALAKPGALVTELHRRRQRTHATTFASLTALDCPGMTLLRLSLDLVDARERRRTDFGELQMPTDGATSSEALASG
jgi:hypothetical protein